VEPFTAAVLRQLVRVQALTRVPLVGLTAGHTRRGMVLSVDASPDAVARAIAQLVRKYGAKWLLENRRLTRPSRRRAGARRRRTTAPAAEAAPLIQVRVTADRATVNPRAAQTLGIDLRRALRAGATAVTP
jgi:hypothetical protein